MRRNEKEKIIQELTEKLQRAQGIYIADYSGLDVASLTELRRKLASASVEFLVVKNTLARLAAEQAGVPEMNAYLEGPTSFALGYDDAVVPARVLADFIRKHEKPSIRTGLLEGRLLTAEQVAGVATLPSRDQLLAKIAGLAQSPLQGFMSRCQGMLQKLVATLDALRIQKQADEPPREDAGPSE
jgi:large subunit ribosomal protein L10